MNKNIFKVLLIKENKCVELKDIYRIQNKIKTPGKHHNNLKILKYKTKRILQTPTKLQSDFNKNYILLNLTY